MVVHLAIIAGGFLAMWLKNAIPVLVIIIVGKLLIDWRAILKENKKERRTAPQVEAETA